MERMAPDDRDGAAEAVDPAVVGDIEAFVREMVEQFGREQPEPVAADGVRGPGRPKVLPALALWAGVVVCVLRGMAHQSALWRLLQTRGLWAYPRFLVTDQAVYNRLERGGTAPLERLFAQVSAVLAARLAPYARRRLAPFAKEVVALDQSTPDQTARWLPSLRKAPNGDARLLPGKLAGLFDLRRQQWRTLLPIAEARQNEKVAAPAIIEGLPEGSLILADPGYFAFAWFDRLTDAGHFWLSRLRNKASYTLVHTFYHRGDALDAVVWLGAHRADRAKHAVRLVQFTAGGHLYRYITNVLDPRTFPPAEMARLYARRWDIELAIKLVKRELHLHLLWSAKPVVIAQQVWATLLIAQILQALRLEIAGRAGVDPFEVSLPLLVEYLPQFIADGHDPIAAIVERGRASGFIRPSSRTIIHAPTVPQDDLLPLPPDTPLQRPHRYAHRNCRPRPTALC